jgi:hypothetical protein
MKTLLLTASLFWTIAACAQSTGPTEFSGRVTDPMGASIGNAIIDIHWNMPRATGPSQPHKIDTSTTTDKSGTFLIVLPPGFYDVCVHAIGFSPTCETVAIGKEQVVVYKTALKPSSLITTEYGDRFETRNGNPIADDFGVGVPTVPPQNAETEPSHLPDAIPLLK